MTTYILEYSMGCVGRREADDPETAFRVEIRSISGREIKIFQETDRDGDFNVVIYPEPVKPARAKAKRYFNVEYA